MREKILILIITLLNFISCQGQGTKQITEEKQKKYDTNMTQKILEEQVRFGYPQNDVFYTGYNFEKKDYIISIPYIKTILENNVYKFPSQEEFKAKIHQIFGRKLDYQLENEFIYINFLSKCNNQILYGRNDIIDYFGFYINKENRFLSDLYAIPEIIDYQKEFPEIVKFENTIPLTQSSNNEEIGDIKLRLWKDELNLAKQRRFNQLLLISRNKYLFNDDQSRFVWLTNNDEYFMESLVTVFGYTEDKKLLNWVLENNLMPKERYTNKYSLTSTWSSQADSFGSLFWTKTCNNKIIFHQETLELFKEKIQPIEREGVLGHNVAPRLLGDIFNYIQYIIDQNPKDLGITLGQKSEILANLIYFGEQYSRNSDYKNFFVGDENITYLQYAFLVLFAKTVGGNYIKEFERNNYYGLPKYKEWVKDAENNDWDPDGGY